MLRIVAKPRENSEKLAVLRAQSWWLSFTDIVELSMYNIACMYT